MKFGDDYKRIPATSKQSGKGVDVLPDFYMFTVQIVNLFFIEYPKTNKFVTVSSRLCLIGMVSIPVLSILGVIYGIFLFPCKSYKKKKSNPLKITHN